MQSRFKVKPNNMLRSLILSFFLFFCSFSLVSAQSKTTSSDTTRINLNEIGLNAGGVQYNFFAPETYLQGFATNLTKGIFYKYHFKSSAFRIGVSNSGFSFNHDLSKPDYNTYMRECDTFSIAGKSRGTVYNIGYEKNLYSNQILRFYTGADLAVADYTFTGDYESASHLTKSTNTKCMLGAGINPLLGGSVTVLGNFVIAAEINFENWVIREKSNHTYSLPEPAETSVVSTHFVSAPNPLKKVSISILF